MSDNQEEMVSSGICSPDEDFQNPSQNTEQFTKKLAQKLKDEIDFPESKLKTTKNKR